MFIDSFFNLLYYKFRAAKILEELNKKDIKDMQEKYLRNLEKIQKNMKRLEEAQKRIQGIKISEPITHQEGMIFTSKKHLNTNSFTW